jgi:GNAT superfamily N-acetyltransferase
VTDTLAPPAVVSRPGQTYAAAHLRWATIADAPRLAALWRLAYPDDVSDVRDMAAWLEHGGALTLQDDAGALLAALRWREEGRGWRVDRVATRPGERGQGYGRWLATKVEALAIRQNVPHLVLALPRDDGEQQAYYERMGYRRLADDDDTVVATPDRVTLLKIVGGVWQTKAAWPQATAAKGPV